MSFNKYQFLVLFFGFLILSSFLIVFLGFEEGEVIKVPCVDGMNRVNLEGIMCQDTTSSWYGVNSNWSLIMIPVIFLLFFGLFYVLERMKG